MSQTKKQNRKGTILRLIRMLFQYYPKLLPCIMVLICINAVISAIPSIFQQRVIAIIQTAWEQGLACCPMVKTLCFCCFNPWSGN